MDRRSLLRATAVLAAAGPVAAHAQPAVSDAWPARPIRLLVGYAPGGGVDTLARALAATLAESLGQPVNVENRAGASGLLAAEQVARAPADGYTLCFAETGSMLAPLLSPKAAINPAEALLPIAGVGSLGMAIVAGSQQPFGSLAELTAALRAARPGRYSYGSPGVGTIQHLAMELFEQRVGAHVVHIPYRGAAGILPDVVSGQIELGVVSTGPAVAQAKSGRIRLLAVTTAERLAAAPEAPTLSSVGPGLDAETKFWLMGPRGLPAPVAERLAGAVSAALAGRRLQDSFATQAGTPRFADARGAASDVAEQVSKWGAVIRTANIRAD